MELSPVHLEQLCALLSRRSGVALPETRWSFVQSRAGAVMARARLASGHALIEALEAASNDSMELYADLEQALWIHETSFFRYEDHYRILREVALPALVRGRDRTSPVRILSAGCSTGEEPYSIAITVREAVGDSCRVEILGMDASRDALATAQRAVYSIRDLASVPPRLVQKYFVKGADADQAALIPGCRDLVRFFHQDIRTGIYLGKFDAIFCCNLLLYFTTAVKEQVVAWLAASLHRGGCLFLGHADGITPPERWFRASRLPAGLVYQRV